MTGVQTCALPIFTILNLFGCKNSQKSNDSETIIEKSIQKIDSIKPEVSKISDSKINDEYKASFTISCGSGCAVIYNEQSRISNKNTTEIKFNVETFIDEVLSEENEKTYVFDNDSYGKLKSIHLKNSSKNLLLDNDAIIRPDLIKISENFSNKKIGNQDNNGIKLIEENEPYKIIKLPFDSKEFVQNKSIVDSKKYTAAKFLIDYLVKKDYEGEEYDCYFLRSDNEFTYIIVSILRGDSQYFILIKSDKKSILSFNEIGSIGGENTLYFKISQNLIITTYDLNNVEIKKITI